MCPSHCPSASDHEGFILVMLFLPSLFLLQCISTCCFLFFNCFLASVLCFHLSDLSSEVTFIAPLRTSYVFLPFCSKYHSLYHCVYYLQCTCQKYSSAFISLTLHIRMQISEEQGPCLSCLWLYSHFLGNNLTSSRTNRSYVNHVVKAFQQNPQSWHLRMMQSIWPSFFFFLHY